MPVPESAEQIERVVREDVASAFHEAFPGRFEIPEPFSAELPIGTGTTTAVPWRWTGRHEGRFQARPATFLDVEINGVTFLREEGGEVLHHRLVDWLNLFRSIGVVAASRAPFSPRAAENADPESAGN